MQVKSIAECSKGSILQYFRPALSFHTALRPLFYLFFEWPLKTGFTVYTNLPKKLWTVLAFSADLGSSFTFTGLFSEIVASCQEHHSKYTVRGVIRKFAEKCY